MRDVQPAGLVLWDVLKMVPQDVVVSNVWSALSHDRHRALRLVCRASLELCDSLTTLAIHDMSVEADGEAHGLALDRWVQYVLQRASHLTLLRRVGYLSLIQWSVEQKVSAALMAYGAALQCRVSRLRLEAASKQQVPWSNYLCLSVTVYCPHLVSFTLQNVVISADALLPLRQLTTLTQLIVQYDGYKDNVLDGLADVDSLRHLSLDAGSPVPSMPFADISALANLTNLRGQAHPPAASPARLRVAVAALASFTNLCSLRLDTFSFVMDDVAFSAVRLLTRLTDLSLERIALTSTGQGHLPALQRLALGADLLPSQLLETLSPLLPLPALANIVVASEDFSLCLSASYYIEGYTSTTPANFVAEREALKCLRNLLAGAPHLVLSKLCIADGWSASSLRMMFEDLCPIVNCFTSLELYAGRMAVRVVREVARCLPALPVLCLNGCRVDDLALQAINAQLTGLSELRVLGDPEDVDISIGGLEALAAAPRSRVLFVSGDVFEELYEVWDNMQLDVHGREVMQLKST